MDLAHGAETRGDFDAAEKLYEQALARNASSWNAARRFAEFLRHKRRNVQGALRRYEQAASNAPRRGADRALIFREWGMLLRDSGLPDSTDQAIEKFELVISETPNDAVAKCALAQMYERRGNYSNVIELLQPLENHNSMDTRRRVYALLYNRPLAKVS